MAPVAPAREASPAPIPSAGLRASSCHWCQRVCPRFERLLSGDEGPGAHDVDAQRRRTSATTPGRRAVPRRGLARDRRVRRPGARHAIVGRSTGDARPRIAGADNVVDLAASRGVLRGGPHDRFTIDPSRSPSPRALFKRSFVDGSGVGRQERDPSGTRARSSSSMSTAASSPPPKSASLAPLTVRRRPAPRSRSSATVAWVRPRARACAGAWARPRRRPAHAAARCAGVRVRGGRGRRRTR